MNDNHAFRAFRPGTAVLKTSFRLVAVVVLVGAVGLAQVRITSFNSGGELTWTNSTFRGFYSIETASSPAGPWNSIATVADLDWSKTNRMTVQVPPPNAPAFYRVGWIPPDPIGVWDYRGYDMQGTLVITGQLRIDSMTLITSNPPVGYRVLGWRNLNYNGSPTNASKRLGPQSGTYGTGSIAGTVEFHGAGLRLEWPTNTIDFNIDLNGALGPNTYAGNWFYWAWGGGAGGPFNAVRVSSTNLATNP